MSELEAKVAKSIERLKAFEPPEGYYLAFSGGKDSVVCKALLDMAGCKYEAVYRVTSVDPPELVRFIKDQHPDVKREVPRYPADYKNEKLAGKPITMWNLIPEKLMPPTRIVRYCCEKLKESGGDGRFTVTGVRWEESYARRTNQGLVTISSKRAAEKMLSEGEDFTPTKRGGVILTNDNEQSRRVVEQCYKRHKTAINPIIDWTDTEVWEFIRTNNIPYCSLYDEGFKRLGCIGCPLAKKHGREKEFLRWPKYKDAYLRSFDAMLRERERETWKDGRNMANGNASDRRFQLVDGVRCATRADVIRRDGGGRMERLTRASGLWSDGEPQIVLVRQDGPFAEIRTEKTRYCPNCGRKMAKVSGK